MTAEGDSIIVIAGGGSNSVDFASAVHITCADPTNGTHTTDASLYQPAGSATSIQSIDVRADPKVVVSGFPY